MMRSYGLLYWRLEVPQASSPYLNSNHTNNFGFSALFHSNMGCSLGFAFLMDYFNIEENKTTKKTLDNWLAHTHLMCLPKLSYPKCFNSVGYYSLVLQLSEFYTTKGHSLPFPDYLTDSII